MGGLVMLGAALGALFVWRKSKSNTAAREGGFEWANSPWWELTPQSHEQSLAMGEINPGDVISIVSWNRAAPSNLEPPDIEAFDGGFITNVYNDYHWPEYASNGDFMPSGVSQHLRIVVTDPTRISDAFAAASMTIDLIHRAR